MDNILTKDGFDMSKTDLAEVALKVLSVYFIGWGIQSFTPHFVMYMMSESARGGSGVMLSPYGPGVMLVLGSPILSVVIGAFIWATSRVLAKFIAP